MNISTQDNEKTARTCLECASQRAENLSVLGATKVLELCVGPSLHDLEQEYAKYGITVTGNDIDPRWKDYYPSGKWVIGDARQVKTHGFVPGKVEMVPLKKKVVKYLDLYILK